MSKAGTFARPVGQDGKHHPEPGKDDQKGSNSWTDAVHRVADTLRGWLGIKKSG